MKDLLTKIVVSASSPNQENQKNITCKTKEVERQGVLEINDKKNGPVKIEFDQVGKSKGWKVRANVSDWKNNDFSTYLIDQIRTKIDDNYEVNRIGVTLYFGRIKNCISEMLGFCDNIVLKDYIDFFIGEWGQFYVKTKGKFLIAYLKNKEPLKDFCTKYHYADSVNNTKENKKDVVYSVENIDMIEKLYLTGGENIIINYGLIFSFNWLISKKKFTKTEALAYIKNAYSNIKDKDTRLAIIKITEKMAPYPKDFIVNNCEEVYALIGIDING